MEDILNVDIKQTKTKNKQTNKQTNKNKRKEKEYPTVGTVPKSNGKIEET